MSAVNDAIHILGHARRIAVVGASDNPARASHGVMRYLIEQGYECVAVNPALDGRPLLGAPSYATLADVPGRIDMVDVFRNSDAAGAVVDEALALDPPPGAIWMQLGVVNEAAAARARARGVRVVMDRCPKIDYPRHAADIEALRRKG